VVVKAANIPLAKQILTDLLQAAKIQSMREIYNRVRPGPDGRIRTVLSPVATITGRFASKGTFLEHSTNLQNIPKKTAKLNPLFDIRTVMVPDPGTVLMEADLSQAEARATAAFSGDVKTLDLFESGADIHKVTAGMIFDVKPEAVSSTQRHLGKMARHALNYGMGWKRFLEAVNSDADLTGVAINASTARGIVESYHRANGPLLRWWRSIEDAVRKQGYLENPFGRKLVFIEKRDVNSAIAFLPQSTIADHLNGRLRVIYDELDPDPFMLLHQIHDAVLGQVSIRQWRSVARRLRTLMEAPIQINSTSLLVPADVSVSSHSWGEMKEV